MLSRSIRTLGYMMCQIILEASLVESGFHKTPLNIVAVVGQHMKMTCWTKADTTTQWFFKHHSQSTHSLVYNGWAVSPNFTKRFSVHKFNGKYDLTTKNVIMTDAGIYECVELSKDDQGFSTPVSATAELIVLESDPVCNTNISMEDDRMKELDNVAFRCAVNFSGQFIPSMHWSEGESVFGETTVVTNNNVSHGMQHLSSVTILQVTAEQNDIQITCKTQFLERSKKLQNTNATNTPNYLFLCNITLNVPFGARNVTITPSKEIYHVEDALYCNAAGNPRPTYTWRNLRTKESIAVGPQLFLSKTKLHTDQLYDIECIAENNVAGEVKQSSAKVDVKVSENWQVPFRYIIIGAGIGIFCTLVVVFIVIWIQKQHISRISRDNAGLTERNIQNPSPDYGSIPEVAINEMSIISTAQEAAEDEGCYSELTERPVIIQLPVVYSSLDANTIHLEDHSNMAYKEPQIYVNIAKE